MGDSVSGPDALVFGTKMAVSRSARRGAGAVLLVALAAAGATLGFGPLVRSRLAAEADRRSCDVVVGGLRPGWFSMVFTEIHVKLRGVDGVDIQVPTATLALTALLGPRTACSMVGRVSLKGEPEVLRGQLQAWRASGAKGGGGERGVLPVRSERMAVQWDNAEDRVSLNGLEVARDETGLKVLFEKAEIQLGSLKLALGGGAAELDPASTLKRLKLAEANVGWSLPEGATDGAVPGAPAPPATGDLAPPPLPAQVTKGKKPGRKPVVVDDIAPMPAVEASAPLVPMPDLHRLRAIAASLGALLSQRLPEGATVSVEGLKLRLERGGEERVSLGPGPLEVVREGSRVEVTFSTGGAALGTPMSVHAVVPSDDGDVELSLAGGQVPLSLLGLRAKVLTELDRATLAGKGRVVLDGKGKTLTFDGQLTFRGLAAHDPRLAADVVRGLDFEARARGVLSDRGELRLDDVEAAMGALRVEGHGGIEQTSDHVAAAVDFELPVNSCEAVIASIPTALVPTLRGAHMHGTFGARGRLSFDTRKLDDLSLDYTIEDRCRLERRLE